ncbi:MAG: 1,6-anhydro-N-acetylmuramyl-L-alanine amidase AmpD [Pseudomonadota bacterium]|jgi:AmpD protein
MVMIVEHKLSNARFLPSPNCNARPEGVVIDLIVVHNISLPAGCFGTPYVEQFFCNTLDCFADPSFADLQGLEVSAHLLIKRDGSMVQFVPFDQRAWHAGVSSFDGREGCNDFSIGIELEGDDVTPYTDQQYLALGLTVVELIEAYGIPSSHIVGHCDIAPGRKTDPGSAFDWAKLRSLLATLP